MIFYMNRDGKAVPFTGHDLDAVVSARAGLNRAARARQHMHSLLQEQAKFGGKVIPPKSYGGPSGAPAARGYVQ